MSWAEYIPPGQRGPVRLHAGLLVAPERNVWLQCFELLSSAKSRAAAFRHNQSRSHVHWTPTVAGAASRTTSPLCGCRCNFGNALQPRFKTGTSALLVLAPQRDLFPDLHQAKGSREFAFFETWEGLFVLSATGNLSQRAITWSLKKAIRPGSIGQNGQLIAPQ
jgi:hypothetical protein